ncbi:RnfABCDGE type electron transport complex subunit D [Rhodoferax sp. 4810]|uniref:Ion-translocating oxidoreductase complex subunit D n=1 Tax=Thiospirillum jenense TaxID=1653858 RepID=A0A839HFQ6_9GAMM|nr:RnfABCDGE type electron transport complex subunit D [Thiospirillum jenense]MBB1073933.1 RnfABCDGE type electron transport complex subunit D [Rhodoferax jenense]MBB1125809.1 RnfABCDGE type electron transport complex subunit D [Thiospirillum jenense]
MKFPNIQDVSDRSGPFAHTENTVQRTMFTVLLALVPATVLDLYLFGWPAIFLFGVTVGSCVFVEAFSMVLAQRRVIATISDGSAVLTGWLLAMTLPPWAPWWIGLLGAVFAILLAKQPFGGLGQNLFNPAMVARVALLVSFPVAMTAWVAPHPLFTDNAPSFNQAISITFHSDMPDGITAATALGYVKTELSRGIPASQSVYEYGRTINMTSYTPYAVNSAVGYKSGSLGETSAFLILLGGLFLIRRRIITWHIPGMVLGTIFVFATVFNLVNPDRFSPAWFHLISGATFLGAFFIATDYVTSPVSKTGQLIFGFGVGALTWVIRTFAGYPEGMAFAVLLMNSVTPIIDQYTRPRLFGRTRKGDPLPVEGK